MPRVDENIQTEKKLCYLFPLPFCNICIIKLRQTDPVELSSEHTWSGSNDMLTVLLLCPVFLTFLSSPAVVQPSFAAALEPLARSQVWNLAPPSSHSLTV